MKWRVDFRREILAQSVFSHPNIVAVRAICMNPVAMALEFCRHGELFKLLHAPDQRYGWRFLLKVLAFSTFLLLFLLSLLPPPHAGHLDPHPSQVAVDVASALDYMQSLSPPWVHRDLKTPNVLLKSFDPSDKTCALLTDFGTSAAVDEPLTVRVVDNPTWLAPEVLRGLPYGVKVLIFVIFLLFLILLFFILILLLLDPPLPFSHPPYSSLLLPPS